jgi:hypothetical protein
MTHRVTVAFSLILLSSRAWSQSSQGPQIALDRLQNLGNSRISEFRTQVRPFLSDRERSIEDSIDYAVLSTGAVNAQAVTKDGKRKIVVGAGVLQIFEWLSVGDLMQRWGARECGIEYSKHIFTGVIANGQAPQSTRVYEPFAFASRHPDICSGASYAAFDRDAPAKQLQMAMVGASYRFLLAHELAHHIFNHHAQNNEQSRTNEEQADAFAFRVSSYDPSAIGLALPAYQVLANLGAEVEDEAKSSHPAGLRRMQSFAGALKALPTNDPAFRRYLAENGLTQRWNQAVDQLVQQIAEGLGN